MGRARATSVLLELSRLKFPDPQTNPRVGVEKLFKFGNSVARSEGATPNQAANVAAYWIGRRGRYELTAVRADVVRAADLERRHLP